ncbi:MAG: hypothetical protein IEMM0006_2069 [bacterium]|nr:MAG: hypothetical protein IEMM0006_2069 [bacterium]
MKTNYLLPNRFKKAGWFLFITGIILGMIYLTIQDKPDFLNFNVFAIADQGFLPPANFFTITQTNIFDEIIALLLIVSSVFIALSKEKTEDEYISKIRLESLVWATYVNYAILIIAIIFVFDLAFFWVLVFNMFTILFFFLIRFNWVLYKSKKMMRNEK